MSTIEPRFQNIQVFVYCGGKCGSQTLAKTLSAHFNVLHVHNAEHFPIQYDTKDCTIFDVLEYNRKTQEKIYIIDSYRDPIERKIASFFNNIDVSYLPHYQDCSLEEIIDFFNTNALLEFLENIHPLDEAMDFYGVPHFQTFDFDRKYNLAVKDNIHFIKLRFQDIDHWGTILSDLFKRNISVESENKSEDKPYASIYNQFKEAYTIPADYFYNTLLTDAHFQCYHSEEEKQQYCKKWEPQLAGLSRT